MAVSQAVKIALAVAFFGSVAFIFGVIAGNKKPLFGTPVHMRDVVICKYPRDPTVALGSLSAVALFISAILGLISVYPPYKGKSVPTEALVRSTTLVVFFTVAVHKIVVHIEMFTLNATVCYSMSAPQSAFHALDAEMLTLDARADYLVEDDPKGSYVQVLATDYENAAEHSALKL